MPFIKSLVSKCYTYIVAIILFLGEIMPTYFCCILKGLVYIAIITLFSRQPSSYTKCIKSNIHSTCNIKLVSVVKYIYFIYFIIL